MRELHPRARLLVVAVLASATAVLVWAVSASVDATATYWSRVAALWVLFALATHFATRASSSVGVSVSYIVGLAAVILIGPAGAAIVGTAAIFTTTRGVGRHTKRLFNASMFALCAVVAGHAWGLFAGTGLPSGDGAVAEQLLGLLAATLAYFVLNNGLVAMIVSLTSGLSLRRTWAGSMSWLTLSQLGYGLMGLLLAHLYDEMGPASAVFFLAPLLVARQAFDNYAQQREAYDSTVRAFAQAVETKDFYTRGHSERVSRVAEMIAREHGMREDRVQVIRIAGMLHDVGKLGVPTRVLQKQGKLNELEFEAIKLHPLRGYEMLCEIEFLHEALDGVYHHHERMDGRGYPMGLTGEEIPEFARIVMVADAFDSMTSTRSYRQAKSVDEAITELRRCEQVQFDPHMVDCLVRAIGKHGWEPHAEDYHGEQVSRETMVMRPGHIVSSFEQAEQRRG
jgi:hypothetical protein